MLRSCWLLLCSSLDSWLDKATDKLLSSDRLVLVPTELQPSPKIVISLQLIRWKSSDKNGKFEGQVFNGIYVCDSIICQESLLLSTHYTSRSLPLTDTVKLDLKKKKERKNLFNLRSSLELKLQCAGVLWGKYKVNISIFWSYAADLCLTNYHYLICILFFLAAFPSLLLTNLNYMLGFLTFSRSEKEQVV